MTSSLHPTNRFVAFVRPHGLRLAISYGLWLLPSLMALAQPLTLTGLSPVRNARTAPLATNVALSFSQPLTNNAATQNGLRVYSAQRGGLLRNGQGGTATVSGNTISFNPSVNFKPGETVYVTSTTAIQSTGGARLVRGQVYGFTTQVGGSGRGNFTAPPTNPNPAVGNAPRSVALGDVDGDGDLDLLTANQNSDNVSVRLNDGTSNFSPHPTNPNPAVGNNPYSVALGDVDGDGDLDFLCANLFDDNVSVRLNDGGGNFTPPPTNPNPAVGNAPVSVALGDLDGDGDLDMLTANAGSNTVSVRLNDGTGNFTPPTNPNLAMGNEPGSVAVGDVDGDGDLDLLCANVGSANVSVRLNDGGGNFTPPPTNPNPAVGNAPRSVALGDVDGDGDLDLLTANGDSDNVSVRLNDGGGNFTPPATNPNPAVGDNPFIVALGDVDGDGDLDLLTANLNSNTVSVRVNDGTGNFTPPPTNPNPSVGTGPQSVALGDVDVDGDLDLLTANFSSNTVSVRLNGLGDPTLAGLSATPNPVLAGSALNFTATVGNFTGSYSFSLTNGVPATTLSGTATATAFSQSLTATGSGVQSFTLTVESGGGRATATVSVTVTPGTPTISDFQASPNAVCAGSTVTFTATVPVNLVSRSGLLRYELTNGTDQVTGNVRLPSGSSTINVDLEVEVTPTVLGPQTFTVTTNYSFESQELTATASLTVNALPTAGLTSSGTLTCANTSVTLTASGGTSYTFTTGSGQLLPGSGNTRSVSSPGTYSVRVANASGCVSTTSTSVASSTATVTVSNPLVTTATTGVAFSQSFTASGGIAPYSYSVVRSNLPASLSLSSAGVLSGTPTAAGSYSVLVQARDANGCVGVGSIYSLSVAAAPVLPAPLVLTPANGSQLNRALPTFSGTALVGSQVRVFVDGNPIGVTTTEASGNWSFTPTTPLADGQRLVYATATVNDLTSPTSNTNSFTIDTQPPAAPLVNTPANGSVQGDNTPTYTGTADPNSTLTVFVDGSPIGSTTATAGGNWSFTQTVPLSEGSHTVRARAADAVGNTSVDSNTNTFSIDTTPPAAPVVSSPANGATLSDTTPAYAGTAEPFSTVSVVVDGSPIGTTSAGGGGNWSFTQTAPLSPGSHTVTARATDLVGNTSVDSNPNTFSIDATQPVVSLTTSASSPTTTSPIPVTITFSKSVTGLVVGELSVSNGTLSGFAGSGRSYTVTVTPVAPGLVTLQVGANVAQDEAGNGNTASEVLAIEYRLALTITGFATSSAVCVGSPVPFTATLGNLTGPYNFTLNNGLSSLNGSGSGSGFSGSLTASGSGVQTVTLTVSSDGQTATATTGLTVNAGPGLSLTALPSTSVSQGQSVTLSASSGGSGEPLSFTWSSGVNTPTINPPTSATGSVVYSVTGTTGDGCVGTAQITLTVSATTAPPTGVCGSQPGTLGGPLTILEPGYNCQTGLIQFRTAGGDGSPITYAAIGITGPTTSCSAMVDAEAAFDIRNQRANIQPFTLFATQGNVTVTYAWNALASCAGQGGNGSPRVQNPVGPQSATVGVGYSLDLSGVFTDTETPGQLSVSVSGLPAGLQRVGSTILGTPTQAGLSSVTLVATDPGNLATSTVFSFSVSSAQSNTGVGGPLSATVVSYDCASGAILFGSTGGNGSAVEYFAIGITGWTTNPNQMVEADLRADPQPITLRVRQSGLEGQAFVFDFGAFCQNGGTTNTAPVVANPVGPQSATVGVAYSLNVGGVFTDAQTPAQLALSVAGLPVGLSLQGGSITGVPSVSGVSSVTLVATDPGGLTASTSFVLTVSPGGSSTGVGGPLSATVVSYDCGSGAILFGSTGGNGSGTPAALVEYFAIGVTGWTASPSQVIEAGLRADPKPITVRVRQHGVEGQPFVFDFGSFCSGAPRLGQESSPGLAVRVLGNPLVSEWADIEVVGARGRVLQVRVLTSQGRVQAEQVVEQPGAVEQLRLRVGNAPGVYLLEVQTPDGQQQLKLVRL